MHGEGLHACLVAEDATLRALARRVDGEDGEFLSLVAKMYTQSLNEGALASARHTRDAQP